MKNVAYQIKQYYKQRLNPSYRDSLLVTKT